MRLASTRAMGGMMDRPFRPGRRTATAVSGALFRPRLGGAGLRPYPPPGVLYRSCRCFAFLRE